MTQKKDSSFSKYLSKSFGLCARLTLCNELNTDWRSRIVHLTPAIHPFGWNLMNGNDSCLFLMNLFRKLQNLLLYPTSNNFIILSSHRSTTVYASRWYVSNTVKWRHADRRSGHFCCLLRATNIRYVTFVVCSVCLCVCVLAAYVCAIESICIFVGVFRARLEAVANLVVADNRSPSAPTLLVSVVRSSCCAVGNVQDGTHDDDDRGRSQRTPYPETAHQSVTDFEQRTVAQGKTDIHAVHVGRVRLGDWSRPENRRLRVDPDRWNTA